MNCALCQKPILGIYYRQTPTENICVSCYKHETVVGDFHMLEEVGIMWQGYMDPTTVRIHGYDTRTKRYLVKILDGYKPPEKLYRVPRKWLFRLVERSL